MVHFDGYGNGKSCYWEYLAKRFSQESSEACGCDHSLEVKFSSCSAISTNISITVNCITCKKEYKETQEKITKIFFEFYKIY